MPSFAEALYSLSTEKLHRLIQLRGVDPRRLSLVPSKRSLVQQLAGEFSKQASVASILIKCGARDLRLLQLASSVETSRGFTWSNLVEMAGGGEGVETSLDSIADQLETLGLMFRVGSSVYVPDTVRHMTPASLSDRYTIARLLNMYDAPAIRRVVYKLGLEAENTTKSSNIDVVRNYLLESLPSLRLNPPLSDAELGAIEFLIRNGGSATPFEVAGVLKDGSSDDFFRYEWQNRWKQGKERNAVDSLLARGILYVVTSGYGYNLFLVIPGELLTAITGPRSTSFWTNPVPAPAPPPNSPQQTRRHTTLIRDMVCMLSFFSVQSAARTSTGHIHKSSLKTVARMLSFPDELYATFIYAICREAGLAAPDNERQLYGLTPQGRNWLDLDFPTQHSILVQGWRNGIVWAEMYSEPLMRKNDYRSGDAAVAVRDAVLNLLSEIKDPEAFTTIESIASTMMFRYPLLLSDSISMYSSSGGSGSLASFVRVLVTETLYWLGIVELGIDRAAESVPILNSQSRSDTGQDIPSSSVSSFRITPAGTALLQPDGEKADTAEPREDRFVVQANAEIFIPPYLEPSLLYRLLMITDLPAGGAAGSTTTLTRDSIRRAFDLGDTPEKMLAFLQTHSRTGVPQNVEYLINEVGGKHGHIHVGNAHMYLQVNSPLLMKELQSRRELKGYFVRTLNDTVAILKADDIEKVLKDLRKAGYLPVSDESAQSNPFAAQVAVRATRGKSNDGAAGKLSKALQDPYSSIDWERISRDDDTHWHQRGPSTAADITKPGGAYDNPSLIRVMLHNACITHNIVDLVWREIGQEAIRTLFEPIRISGNTVSGYSQDNEDILNIEVDMIRWARLTPDKF